jgi:hypothetical protein
VVVVRVEKGDGEGGDELSSHPRTSVFPGGKATSLCARGRTKVPRGLTRQSGYTCSVHAATLSSTPIYSFTESPPARCNQRMLWEVVRPKGHQYVQIYKRRQ